MARPDMVGPKRIPTNHVPDDLQETLDDIGAGQKLGPNGEILEQNLRVASTPETPIFANKSVYFPELTGPDLNDFFLIYRENIDHFAENLVTLKDDYFTALQMYEQLDSRYEDLEGDAKAEAKRNLIKYQDKLDYYTQLFGLLKRYAYGTDIYKDIPDV